MNAEIGKPLREVFGETLVELVAAGRPVVVLDGDLGNSTRADILEQAYPDRFFQMGIAEQNMLGVAAGMATVGHIPFISTFACFAVARALDSIRVLIAQPGLNVKIVGSYSGVLAGKTGKTHLMLNDLAVMRTFPGMCVVCPADEVEAHQAIMAVAEYDGPVYMRMTREASPLIFGSDYRFSLGEAVIVRDGRDVTLISTGVQTSRVLEAAELLAGDGIDAHVLHVPTLKPLDEPAIIDAARRTGLVVTIEEHVDIGGVRGAVSETLSCSYPMPVQAIGLHETWGESAPDDALLEKHGLSPLRVARTVRAMVDTAAGRD